MATESSFILPTTPLTVADNPFPPIAPGAEASRRWAAHAKLLRNRMGANLNRMSLERADFTVISNDCWGQALYEELGLRSCTPLIGSGMHAECFLRFLGNIPGYLAMPLRFISASRYGSVNRIRTRRGGWPMAALGDDVEIHFLHYRTEEESRRSWEEGCRRVNLDRLVIKFTVDKDGASPKHIAMFDRLPFERKLLLSAHPHPETGCAVQVPDYVNNGAMMFRRSLRYFDCGHWLNTGEIRRSTLRVLINKALYARGV